MKHSNLILTVITCLLAIAAVAMRKGHKNDHVVCTIHHTAIGALPCSTINSLHLDNPRMTCLFGVKKLVTCRLFVKTVFVSTLP